MFQVTGLDDLVLLTVCCSMFPSFFGFSQTLRSRCHNQDGADFVLPPRLVREIDTSPARQVVFKGAARVVGGAAAADGVTGAEWSKRQYTKPHSDSPTGVVYIV